MSTLHLLCGKIAAGKSTLSAKLAAAPNTIVLSEDYWLSSLYPGEIGTLPDYVRCSARLRVAIGPHIESLLRAGISVVLDFQANTVNSRDWMREIFLRAGADHQLHFLDVSDEICKARLRQRNASGTHEFAASDAEFDQITRYFVPPSEAEGFNVVLRTPDDITKQMSRCERERDRAAPPSSDPASPGHLLPRCGRRERPRPTHPPFPFAACVKGKS